MGAAREVFKGKTYRIIHQKIKNHGGKVQTYEFVEKPSGVLVIAINKEGFVTLVREKRVRKPNEKEQWSLPGGYVEPKEQPEKAAVRELMEETGLTGSLKFFERRPQDPRTIWDLRCFLVQDAKIDPSAKPQLETKEVPLFEAVQMAIEGDIETDFGSLCLIRYAQRANRLEVLEKELDPRLQQEI